MLHLLLWDERVDRAFIAAHTRGFDALKRDRARVHAARRPPRSAASPKTISCRPRAGSPTGPTLSLYCQGLNQSSAGTAKNAALINLHLATGQIGKPGAGPFSLTGQPNAMGGREVGGMANLLSGASRSRQSRRIAPRSRRSGASTTFPRRPGLTAVEMFDALAAGAVKMVWIACTNPAQSMPDQATVRAGLARAELVVLQEA